MRGSIALFGLLLAVATASPTKNVVPRAVQSPYPGPSGACTHELKYLNFNYEDKIDKTKADYIHDTFCKGIGGMFVAAGKAVEAADRTIYERWFVEDDEEDPTEDERVLSVYDQIWNRDTNKAQPLAAAFIIDNNDFLNKCNKNPDDVEIAGYTGEDKKGDKLEKTHFCSIAYDYPARPEAITCGKLNVYPDGSMESFARIMLHELTHYKKVGIESLIEFQIIDSKNDDGLAAYYPSRCHALKTEKPDLVDINADNYALQCKKSFENPLPYVPGHPGDPGEP